MSHDDIVAKVKKLLALSDSPVEAEAKAAMAKAQALMTRHRLTMQQVEGYTDTDGSIIERRQLQRRVYTEDKYVLAIVDTHFFVEIMHQNVDGEHCVWYVGRESDVEVACYIRGFLTETFKRLFKEYRHRTGSPVTARQAYYLGLKRGLDDKLQRERMDVEQEMALVVVDDPALKAHMAENHGDVETVSKTVSVADGHALRSGEHDGAQISINDAVGSSNAPKEIA